MGGRVNNWFFSILDQIEVLLLSRITGRITAQVKLPADIYQNKMIFDNPKPNSLSVIHSWTILDGRFGFAWWCIHLSSECRKCGRAVLDILWPGHWLSTMNFSHLSNFESLFCPLSTKMAAVWMKLDYVMRF